ncbi:hypothetical protein ZTR_10053 [Talaromyces verruculosus]|nr:hypothetical protein ZTR_10053 [Talaromyces verruculosus]
MKYTTALTVLLAVGPATTVLAAPLTQDPGSALTAGPAPSGEKAAPAPGGSSSQGMSGSSTGNEGVLDKVEEIVKDVLSGLRKRGLVEEVGKVAKMTLDSVNSTSFSRCIVAFTDDYQTSKLLNGESSGSQSSYNTQSTDPDALPATAPRDGKDDDKDDDGKKAAPAPRPAPAPAPAPVPAPAPAPAPKDDSSSSNSELSKLLGGRSVSDQIDPINTSGTTAPISNSAVEPSETHHLPSKPSAPVAPAPATKESAPVEGVAPLDTQKQNVEESKKEKEGPNDGTSTTDAFKLTPEEIEALKKVLASQSKGKSDGEDVPGLDDE